MKLREWWRDKFGDLFTVKEVPCEYCGGAGVIYSDRGPAPNEEVCEQCDGSGVVECDVYEEPNSVRYNGKVTL